VSDDSKLTVSFELLGLQETTRIKQWEISSGYLTSTDGFSFTILPDNSRPELRDLELQPVELLVNNGAITGASQLKGRIDKTTIGNDGVAIQCEGRDYLADLVECNVDPSFKVKESMTLGDAIFQVTNPCGILAVLGDEDVGMQNIRTGVAIRRKKRRNKKTTPLQDLQPRPTEGVYEFCNRLAARHGVTVQPAPDRTTLVLNAPDYEQETAGTIHITAGQRQGTRNNVISATAVRDFSRFPTYTIANGKQARSDDKPTPIKRTFDMLTVAANLNPELKRILSAERIARGRQMPGKATLSAPQLFRLLHVEDIDARSEDQIIAAAMRAVAERFKDTLEYTVTLRGHFDPDTGCIWSVNTLVHVIDEIRGIDEPLWVSERMLSFDPRSGATTRLTLWRPDSFQIEPPS